MNQVMTWVKANVFTVIFVLLIIAAPIAMWFVAGGLNAGVQAQVKKRYNGYDPLLNLQKTTVVVPGDPSDPGAPHLVNEAILTEYERVSKIISEDAKAIVEFVVERNQHGRSVLMPELLPQPAADQEEVLPAQFHALLVKAYENLRNEVHGCLPPTLESMRPTLETERGQFMASTIKKELADPLNAEEQKLLTDAMSNVRLDQYMKAATGCGLYLDMAALHVPEWVQTEQPSLAELYNWQWQFWAVEDVLMAIHDINTNGNGGTIADANVINAAVKQVLNIAVNGLPEPGKAPAADSAASSNQGSGGRGAGGRISAAGGGSGAMGRGAPPKAGSGGSAGGGGAPAAAPGGGLDYSRSFTGRKSNNLYDVVTISLRIIVETERLPQVLDALAKRNFITVIDLDMQPADAYAAIREGYFYGSAPVSDVTLELETIWLRQWTTPFMPTMVKDSLGIASPKPAAEADAAPANPKQPGRPTPPRRP